MLLVSAGEVSGRYGIREREERRVLSALRGETLNDEAILVIEHRYEALLAHIASSFAVNVVTHCHVIG